tara:strand:+ start:5398 stop:5739 length:342 start_codon:yes stop_codon:yes gene_type:complete
MEKVTITKKDVVESPKDTILDAVVIAANKTCWAEIIAPDKLAKFDEPNKEIIQILFETAFNGTNLAGEDTMAYYEKPMSNSKMGTFLIKYDSFEPGTKIKVIYDDKGFASIHL